MTVCWKVTHSQTHTHTHTHTHAPVMEREGLEYWAFSRIFTRLLHFAFMQISLRIHIDVVSIYIYPVFIFPHCFLSFCFSRNSSPKMHISWKCAFPHVIQDVDEFVSSLEQIWRNLSLNHLLISDPLQWMGAVRMRAEKVSVINKFIWKMFFASNHCFWILDQLQVLYPYLVK